MRAHLLEGHPNRSELFDLKHDRGGMIDVEFLVQYLVLANAAAHPSLTANDGNLALLGMAALVLVVILTVQGLLMLFPVNIRVYLELRKPAPDGARIGRLMKFYIRMMAIQGVTQIAMIVVMARFVTGL